MAQNYDHSLSFLFKDLVVIELAGVLAGPSVGLFLAELGARVIKIENPNTGGDVTRTWRLPGEQSGTNESAYYWSVNTKKEILFLDLKRIEAQQTLHALVEKADIVITNYKLGDAVKNGADYATLSHLQPKLIYASVNGFGENSPRTAYDLILQAESGFMSLNGTPDSGPIKMPVALIDLLAAHQLKEALLIALLKRERLNCGSHISVSLFNSAIASLANQATNWLIAHHLPQRTGSLHPNIAPYGEVFTTHDQKQITFAIGNDDHFKSLCELAALTELISDERYRRNTDRVKNRVELFESLQPAIKALTYEKIHRFCQEKHLPMGLIRNLKEVFELPEAKELLRNFEHEGNLMQSVSGIAFNFHA